MSDQMVSSDGSPRDSILGILGGGQLGRMMALAAANLGITVKTLDPSEEACARSVSIHVKGHFRDKEQVKAFADSVDVLTVEIEHVDCSALVEYESKVRPAPKALEIIQDKFVQKLHFQSNAVPLGEFMQIESEFDAGKAGEVFGYPFMLKSRRLAYDGKGNYVVRDVDGLQAGLEQLGGVKQGLYAEKWQPFVKEVAVMVVRRKDGTTLCYPLVETIQKDNICHVTEAPADVPVQVTKEAIRVAEVAIASLSGAGIFGVEMFVMPDNKTVLLNEVAPRPHNSGHYTMDGCVTSQFENHVRAVMGWPLGDPSLNAGCAIMVNLLGEADGSEGMKIAHDMMRRAYETSGCKVHWYAKCDTSDKVKKGRKLGHINIVAGSRAACRAKLAIVDPLAALSLNRTANGSKRSPLVGIIMGSDSDLPTMCAAAKILEEDFQIPVEVTIVSAHRTPERLMEYARTAHERGLKVIIAGAGGAAHLPGMVAAMTPLPTIGVPVKPAGSHLDGVDALLSIVQMPRGVPVATVAIGNATNAGLLAARILASHDAELRAKMLAYQSDMRDTVLTKAEKLEEVGWKTYLKL